MQGITQIINAENGKVENLAEFCVANLINGYLNVSGTLAPAGKEAPTRVDVAFTAFSLRLGILPELKIPLGWPKKPTVGLSSAPCWGLWLELQPRNVCC